VRTYEFKRFITRRVQPIEVVKKIVLLICISSCLSVATLFRTYTQSMQLLVSDRPHYLSLVAVVRLFNGFIVSLSQEDWPYTLRHTCAFFFR